MKNFTLLVVFLLGIGFSNCDDPTTGTTTTVVDTTKNTRTQVNVPEQPKVPPAPELPEAIEAKSEAVDFASFNQELTAAKASQEYWTATPILIALKFVGEGMDCRKKTIEVESMSGVEYIDKLRVIITEDGLLDDSIRGIKHIVRMSRKDGNWQITKASRSWCCWNNRGHVDYSSEPCN